MNKFLIVVLILILPLAIAVLWFFSVSQDNVAVSNVSTVFLSLPDGSDNEYTSQEDKAFFVEFKKSIVSIEKQEYDPEVYSLYKLKYERPHGDIQYYLCLSADVRNCLAYDSNGNWYRIDKEYAKKFLAKYDTSSVYRNSDVPKLNFTAGCVSTEFMPTTAQWHYLLTDESYAEITVNEQISSDVKAFVTAGVGFDFAFDVEPDWYDVKIYEGDAIVYDALINSVTEFSHGSETVLRAVVDAEWYESTTSLYHGEAVYEFYFDYDIKAEYSISSDTVTCGDIVFVSVFNANNEDMTVTTTIPSVNELSSYLFVDKKVVIVPVPANVQEGEYKINIRTDKTDLSIPVFVKAKNYDTAKLSFVGGEGAMEYQEASKSFLNEISDAFLLTLNQCRWGNGLIVPVQKFIDGTEQYWVSAPSYGVNQRVDGVDVSENSMGIHYVKSVAAESLPVRSIASGVVAFAGTTKLYGNTVVIEHGFGFKSVYGHLDSLAFDVGDDVEAGAFLGDAKPSGFSVANTELFFGICIDGVFLNPYNFIVEPRTADSSEVSEPFEFFNIQN